MGGGCTMIRFILRKTNLLPVGGEQQIPMRKDDAKDEMSQKSHGGDECCV